MTPIKICGLLNKFDGRLFHHIIKIKMRVSILLIICLLQSLTVQQATNLNFVPKEDTYYRLTTMWKGDDYSLDVALDGTDSNVQFDITGAFSGQYWKFKLMENNYYVIVNAWRGNSLSAVNDGVNNKIKLIPPGSKPEQYWKISNLYNGYYRLTTKWLGLEKSLDGPAFALTGSYSGQFWKITEIVFPPKFIPKENTSYRFTTLWKGENNSLDVLVDGVHNNLQFYTSGAYSGQYWKFVSFGNDKYQITSEWQEGKAIDIVEDGLRNRIHLTDAKLVHPGQFWKITNIGNDYYRITSFWLGDHRSLDGIAIAPTGNYSGQMWKITEIVRPNLSKFLPGADSYFRLTTMWKGDNNSLDVALDGTDKNIRFETTGDYQGQYWQFKRMENDYYVIINAWKGNSLAVVKDGPNFKPTLTNPKSSPQQLWKLTFLGNDYYRLTTKWLGDERSLDGPAIAETGSYSGQNWKLTQVKRPNHFVPKANAYYRLTTMWQGSGKPLEAVNGKIQFAPMVYQSSYQKWKFTGSYYYHITNAWTGEGKSLDIVKDEARNKIELADTGSHPSQLWKITQIGNGYYRISSSWLSDHRSLDGPAVGVSGNYTGQYWSITEVL